MGQGRIRSLACDFDRERETWETELYFVQMNESSETNGWHLLVFSVSG